MGNETVDEVVNAVANGMIMVMIVAVSGVRNDIDLAVKNWEGV